MRGQLAIALAAFSVVVGVLSFGLRPDAFFVGDPGVKLASTRNTLDFPTHPLNIPLPTIGTDAAPHVENFFAVHGDHAHAVTSEFFPVLSAPMLAAFGLRGLYVLPAIGFVAAIAACAWLAIVLDPRRNAALVAVAAGLGTPFLFYGLEYWEHTLALAAGVGGTVLLLDAARRRPGQDARASATFVAGLLMGVAIVLRPEAACFVVAVMLASRTLVHRPSWRTLAVAAAGACVALLPLEVYTIAHFGSFVPGHISANAGLADNLWGAERLTLAFDWLLPSGWNAAGPVRASSFWSVAPVAVVGVFALAARSERKERLFLALVALLTTMLVVLMAPNEGGGQWGPRYLLFAYVPLAVLAADAVPHLPRRVAPVLLIVLVVAACGWTQRAAYRQLRGTKATYGRVVDLVATATQPGAALVTDVWWLDQVAASTINRRTFLFAGDAQTGHDIVHRLGEARVTDVTMFRSREVSTDLDGWTSSTCYAEQGREESDVRGLVAIRLRLHC